MEKTLEQDQIDALFKSARVSGPAPVPETGPRAVPYNYSRAGQISSDQLRAISVLNDLFARNLTHTLMSWLRTECQVHLVSAEQIPYSEFMSRVPELAFIGSVRLEPLRALSVLQLELAPIPAVVDALLGGTGQPGPVRELTVIEEQIVIYLVEMICRELSEAWASVDLRFNFVKRQMHTEMSRLLPVTERSLCLSFEIRMQQSSGLLNLAFPALVSNAVLRRLTVDRKRQTQHAEATAEQMRKNLERARIGTALQLPSAQVRLSRINDLQPGQVLQLPISSRVQPTLRAAGVDVFRAAPVRSGTQRAARVLSLSDG